MCMTRSAIGSLTRYMSLQPSAVAPSIELFSLQKSYAFTALRCIRFQSDLAGKAKEENEMAEKRKKLIKMEYELLKYSQPQIPESLTDEQWQELYSIPSVAARHRFLNYAFRVEKSRENRIERKRERSMSREEIKKEIEERRRNNPHINYGVGQNSLYYVIRNATIDRYYNQRLIRNMQLAPPLVVDMSYDKHMTRRERKNCAEQIMMLFGNNRMHEDPFHLHLCCAEPHSDTVTHLNRFMPPLYEETFPLTITEKSYLDLFPKEKIVYLTPDTREDLNWDHDAVYVMGAIVDKGNAEPLSLAKAKREGLKMARLPLDRHLHWGSGSGKRLTLDVMIKVLLEINLSGDWKKALTHIPQRKLQKDFDPIKTRHHKRRNNFW